MSPIWQHIDSTDLENISDPLKTWLLDKGSMIARLKSTCNEFHVQVLKHDWSYANDHEASLLNLNSEKKVLVREVLLCCDAEAWMYAKTIFPASLVNSMGTDIKELSDRPLGELLFSRDSTKRSEFEISQLKKDDDYFMEAAKASHQQANNMWARRSKFILPEGTLLLTEVFLPKLISAVSKGNH